MPDLICPKCQSPMRAYERNGVTLDQCTGCRGLFLDRGELERLVDAEGAYYERAVERDKPREPDYREPTLKDYFGGSHSHSHGSHGHHGSHGGHRKKRKSFLEDLFD